jgi:hypothetical protein
MSSVSRPATALVLFALAACNEPYSSESGIIRVEGEAEVPSATLSLDLDASTVIAGDGVGYTARLVRSDGLEEDVSLLAQSDLEPLLQLTDGAVWPTVAGAHELTVTTEFRGEPIVGRATLEVTAAEPEWVDLQLSDVAFPAGQGVEWAIAGWDRYGNPVDTTAADLSVDRALSIDGARLTGTSPGAYAATATLGAAVDTEVVVVLAAPPAQVVLTLSDEDLELYETTSAVVEITDAYGNRVDAPHTLSVTGDGRSTVSGRNVTVWEEGWFTVRVDVDDTALFDEVGPLLVDSTGPVITVDDPPRGGWVEGDASTAAGQVDEAWSGVASLTIDGDPVTPAGDGTYSHGLSHDFGLNIIETVATDGDGNTSTDTRAVLAGDFLAEGESLPGGMEVRLHEGTGGLGTLEVLGEGLLSAADLSSLIPSPVVSQSSQTCVNIWPFGRQCITWYSVSLYVTNPRFGCTDLTLDPLASGVLDATFEVSDVALSWSAGGRVTGVGWSASGQITADAITVDVGLQPSVQSSQLVVDLVSTSASTTNFYFDMNGSLYSVLSFFGLDTVISSAIAGFLETAVEDAVEGAVPDLLNDALSDLEIGIDLDVQGNTYAFDARPSDVSVDAVGLTLGLGTTFEPVSWNSPHLGPALGSLYADYSPPVYTGSPGTLIGVTGDFLNQALHGLWAGGVLDMELESGALGLDPADLAFLFPGLTQLTVSTEALLPPVVVPGTGVELLDLQLGDLRITLYSGDAATGAVLIDVYVSVLAGLDLSASGGNLEASLGATDLWFDVVVPESNGMAAADTEALLDALVPLILPLVTDALGEIPIPDIQGFSLSGISVDVAGAEDGIVTLGGDLVQR